jgi:hypothetical protein
MVSSSLANSRSEYSWNFSPTLPVSIAITLGMPVLCLTPTLFSKGYVPYVTTSSHHISPAFVVTVVLIILLTSTA